MVIRKGTKHIVSTHFKSIVNALTDGYRTLEPLHIVEEEIEDSTSRSGDGVTD